MQEVVGSWEAIYGPRYGSVDDFLGAHPEAFGHARVNGAGAPVRARQQLPSRTVLITPAAPSWRGNAGPASGVLPAPLQPALAHALQMHCFLCRTSSCCQMIHA
jgi:hypothetical protein